MTYDQQIKSGIRHNFAIVLGVHAFWGLGSAFYAWGTMMPVFLQELGAKNSHIGLMQGMIMLAMFCPQMLAAQATSHLPVKKYFFVLAHYPGLIAVGLLGILTLIGSRADLLIWLCIGCMTMMGLTLSFAIPMWSNLVAKLVPAETRGVSFGVIFFVGGVTGLVGARIAKIFIHRHGLAGFGWGFVGAAVLLAVTVSLFFLLKEPALPEPPIRKSFGEFIAGMKHDLANHREYRNYLIAKCSSSIGTMALPFYAVAARERFGLGPEAAADFTAILLAARMIGSPVFGWVGDRLGFRAVAFCPPALNLTCAALAVTTGHASFFYLIFFLGGLATAADTVSSLNLPIEFCPDADKTTFIAVKGSVTGPIMFLAPIIGGLIAGDLSPIASGGDSISSRFNGTFVTAFVFECIAFLLLLFLVNEPRNTPTAPPLHEDDPDERNTVA